MNKTLFLSLVLVSVFLPLSAYAHETRTYEINGTQYSFTVGSLGEPLVVDDKSGVDLSVNRWGQPFRGAETLLKVEVKSGDIKKTFDLATVYGTLGKYKTTFFLTNNDPLSYRLVGNLEGVPVDLLFECSAAGHNMQAMQPSKARVEVSNKVVQTSKAGAFGCPAQKSGYEFPSGTIDQLNTLERVKDLESKSLFSLIIGATALFLGLILLFLLKNDSTASSKMWKHTITATAVLVVGLVIGYGAVDASKSRQLIHEKPAAESTPSAHIAHPVLEVDATKPLPSVSLKAKRDSKDGYNLNILSKNFTFTPEKVGGAAEANTGHAHLYVNGVKIARLYGPWFNLSASVLKEGKNDIEVTLNANDHSEWAKAGEHISAKITVVK